jgi:uncharacterized protein
VSKVNYILAPDGQRFNPLEPDLEVVTLENIAHLLAMRPRFWGATSRYYSVAEHSVYVAQSLPLHLRLAGLLHDAGEAFVMDVPKPLKAQMPELCEAERQWASMAAFKFSANIHHPGVKAADGAVLCKEIMALIPTADRHEWTVMGKTRNIDYVARQAYYHGYSGTIEGMHPLRARDVWLREARVYSARY